jgi:hypothetical protein
MLATATALLKESSTQYINATVLNRKSGGWNSHTADRAGLANGDAADADDPTGEQSPKSTSGKAAGKQAAREKEIFNERFAFRRAGLFWCHRRSRLQKDLSVM